MKRGILLALLFCTFLTTINNISSDCTPNWECTEWGRCINNSELRVCVDLNSCETLAGKPNESRSCIECISNWSCGNWSSCVNQNQTRTCTDLNNCGIEKIEKMPCNLGCTPNWDCNDWSSCVKGIQIRSCLDLNSCGIDTQKPVVSQSCQNSCTPEWECTQWTPKSCPKDTKTQGRNCTDLNNCGILLGKPEEAKSCTTSFGWMFFFIVAVIVILIGGIFFMIKERKEKSIKKTAPIEYEPKKVEYYPVINRPGNRLKTRPQSQKPQDPTRRPVYQDKKPPREDSRNRKTP